jgi:glycosyltransferase involved in cell wall biosynthesis
VVDNASTDGAAERARDAGCRVIEMGENAGFARAVNRGWRAAKTDWIAILNSDVELDPLVDGAADEPGRGRELRHRADSQRHGPQLGWTALMIW